MKYIAAELHCHTLHSDGKLTVQELIDELKRNQIKATTITDHNTSSAYFESAYCQEEELCILKGVEWTTFYGHI